MSDIQAETTSDVNLTNLREGIIERHPSAEGRLLVFGDALHIPFDIFYAVEKQDWFYDLVQDFSEGLYSKGQKIYL